MARRETREEAEKLQAEIQARHTSRKIMVKEHKRGGFLIQEARICEECGSEFLTSAIGEDEAGGEFCQICKYAIYEQCRAERNAEAAQINARNQAYYRAEAMYYPEEG